MLALQSAGKTLVSKAFQKKLKVYLNRLRDEGYIVFIFEDNKVVGIALSENFRPYREELRGRLEEQRASMQMRTYRAGVVESTAVKERVPKLQARPSGDGIRRKREVQEVQHATVNVSFTHLSNVFRWISQKLTDVVLWRKLGIFTSRLLEPAILMLVVLVLSRCVPERPSIDPLAWYVFFLVVVATSRAFNRDGIPNIRKWWILHLEQKLITECLGRRRLMKEGREKESKFPLWMLDYLNECIGAVMRECLGLVRKKPIGKFSVDFFWVQLESQVLYSKEWESFSEGGRKNIRLQAELYGGSLLNKDVRMLNRVLIKKRDSMIRKGYKTLTQVAIQGGVIDFWEARALLRRFYRRDFVNREQDGDLKPHIESILGDARYKAFKIARDKDLASITSGLFLRVLAREIISNWSTNDLKMQKSKLFGISSYIKHELRKDLGAMNRRIQKIQRTSPKSIPEPKPKLKPKVKNTSAFVKFVTGWIFLFILFYFLSAEFMAMPNKMEFLEIIIVYPHVGLCALVIALFISSGIVYLFFKIRIED